MMPGSSRNWRRTSSMMSPAARPTARIASELEQEDQHDAEQTADEDLDRAQVGRCSS